ncbi:UNVERIFIED_CONTAM: hypothetical protein RMT77_006918 [Armadillidium vulgare]
MGKRFTDIGNPIFIEVLTPNRHQQRRRHASQGNNVRNPVWSTNPLHSPVLSISNDYNLPIWKVFKTSTFNTPSFNGDSFMEISESNFTLRNFSLEMNFDVKIVDGTLFHVVKNFQSNLKQDLLILDLRQRFLELSLLNGEKLATFRSHGRVSLVVPNTVTIILNMGQVLLRLNDEEIATRIEDNKMETFRSKIQIFVGGFFSTSSSTILQSKQTGKYFNKVSFSPEENQELATLSGSKFYSSAFVNKIFPQSLKVTTAPFSGGVSRFLDSVEGSSEAFVINGFYGCLHELKINGNFIDLKYDSPSIKRMHNIEECILNPCLDGPCKNGGTCIPNDKNVANLIYPKQLAYKCLCTQIFTGRHCETHSMSCDHHSCPKGFVCRTSSASSSSCLEASETVSIWGIPDFKRKGFLQLPSMPLNIKDFKRIEIWFLIRNEEGTILYIEENNTLNATLRFLYIGVQGFRLHMIINVNENVTKLTMTSSLTRDTWHRAVFSLRKERVTLFFDNETSQVEDKLSGLERDRFTSDSIYNIILGGFSLPKRLISSENDALDFDGAIQYFRINSYKFKHLISLASDFKGLGIFNGDPCYPNPCKNSGLCIPKLRDFVCRCSPKFIGELCENDLGHITYDQPIYLDGKFPLKYEGKFTKETMDSFSLPWAYHLSDFFENFEEEGLPSGKTKRNLLHIARGYGYVHQTFEISVLTKETEGLVIWASEKGANASHGDFLALSIAEGRPKVSLRMSLENSTLVLNSKENVSDGFWHIIKVTRRRKSLTLKVDNHKPSKKKYASFGTSLLPSPKLFTDGDIWLGGIWHLPIRPTGVVSTNFKGCIDQLFVENKEVHLVYHSSFPYIKFCYIKVKR